jgi:uncharacterized low-complexity protein
LEERLPAKRNLVGIELCGVLGRLHSIEGLAQSNNNAKLNYSAKHDQMLLETSAKADEKRSKPERGQCGTFAAGSNASKRGDTTCVEGVLTARKKRKIKMPRRGGRSL